MATRRFEKTVSESSGYRPYVKRACRAMNRRLRQQGRLQLRAVVWFCDADGFETPDQPLYDRKWQARREPKALEPWLLKRFSGKTPDEIWGIVLQYFNLDTALGRLIIRDRLRWDLSRMVFDQDFRHYPFVNGKLVTDL